MSRILFPVVCLGIIVAIIVIVLRMDKHEAENAALQAQQQDTISDAAYLQAQVDSLMTTRHCQEESCLFDETLYGSIPPPRRDSHCYWARKYFNAYYLALDLQSEVLRRKELEAELKLAAAELVVLRRETLRKGKEEGK